MDLKPHISLAHLSHAYIIEGERESGLLALRELFSSFDIDHAANPDYHEYTFETLLVEHAHDIRREQGLRGSDGARKIFVIAFNAITSESQNALLKTLEEPTEATHFFFLIRTSAMLLPTVRSRMQLVRPQGDAPVEALPIVEKFLSGSVSERMKLIERMTKAKTDDKPKAKEEARAFVAALEPIIYSRFADGATEAAEYLRDIVTTKRELAGRSPSVKLLLEYLALTLPPSLGK